MQSLNQKVSDIEKILAAYMPEETGYPVTVIRAMRYTLSAGGKRIRPMLMDETYRMFGGEDRNLIEPFMAAIEMIHTYSLIHDDLPALDNDDLRRGKPTAHVVFGEDMAILAGDALLNYAYETASHVLTEENCSPKAARAMQILASKPGINGMIGGQVVDVENTGKDIDYDTLMYIHKNKTAALIEASMMIGAVLAGASHEEEQVVERIAENIGYAFQIQDDILDVTSSEDVLGKPAGSDEKNEKRTYVDMKGLEGAKEDVLKYTQEAIDLFDGLGRSNPFLRDLLLALAGRDR